MIILKYFQGNQAVSSGTKEVEHGTLQSEHTRKMHTGSNMQSESWELTNGWTSSHNKNREQESVKDWGGSRSSGNFWVEGKPTHQGKEKTDLGEKIGCVYCTRQPWHTDGYSDGKGLFTSRSQVDWLVADMPCVPHTTHFCSAFNWVAIWLGPGYWTVNRSNGYNF